MINKEAIDYLNCTADKLRVEGVAHSKARQLKLHDIANHINSLDKMICTSCKYYSNSHEIFEHSCHLLSMSSQSQPVPDNFGCNKWEEKKDNKC